MMYAHTHVLFGAGVRDILPGILRNLVIPLNQPEREAPLKRGVARSDGGFSASAAPFKPPVAPFGR